MNVRVETPKGAEGVIYLRERDTGAAWSGSGWVAHPHAARFFDRVDAALAAARGIGVPNLELVMVFPRTTGEMAFPLDPPAGLLDAAV